jgi:hypothetical protein
MPSVPGSRQGGPRSLCGSASASLTDGSGGAWQALRRAGDGRPAGRMPWTRRRSPAIPSSGKSSDSAARRSAPVRALAVSSSPIRHRACRQNSPSGSEREPSSSHALGASGTRRATSMAMAEKGRCRACSPSPPWRSPTGSGHQAPAGAAGPPARLRNACSRASHPRPRSGCLPCPLSIACLPRIQAAAFPGAAGDLQLGSSSARPL